MSTGPQWFVLDVNPYPWKVPPFSPGRAKGGKLYVAAGRDQGLHSYKQAIREQLESMNIVKIEGNIGLYLFFWRSIPEYTTAQGRKARKHEADNTNLQKSTEDALQEYLFDNDRDVVFNQSLRFEQSKDAVPMVIVCAVPFEIPDPASVLPPEVMMQRDELLNRYNPTYVPTPPSTGPIPF